MVKRPESGERSEVWVKATGCLGFGGYMGILSVMKIMQRDFTGSFLFYVPGAVGQIFLCTAKVPKT